MSLEILIYIAVGILWLIVQALSKKNKAQKHASGQSQRPPVTLQDVLTDLDWIPAEQPAKPDPAPVDYQRLDSTFTQPVSPKTQLTVTPIKPRLKRRVSVPVGVQSALKSQLRDHQSVQTAIVVAEILGKPRALQGPWLMRR